MIPGDLLSGFPHRQFHPLPGLLDSWAALPNSNTNACMPMQGGSWYHFYDGLWYDSAKRLTHDILCERRTRYQVSQPTWLNIKSLFDKTSTVACFDAFHYFTIWQESFFNEFHNISRNEHIFYINIKHLDSENCYEKESYFVIITHMKPINYWL